MKNKNIFITGATSGIGKAAALALARQGARLILHGRDAGKAEQVREQIISATGNPNIEFVVADLSLLSEVRRMAAELHRRLDRLDVLINNAGMMPGRERMVTPEGFEQTMAVNLLAPYLLTGLLLDLLRQAPEGRVIMVSSSAHKQSARPDFSDWLQEKDYSPLRAYGNAKLFLILVTQRLATLLPGLGIHQVTVNAMHPGAVASHFSVDSDLAPVLRLLGRLARSFFRTPEKGAETMVWLATAETMKGISGNYFIDCRPAKVGRKYDTKENERRVEGYCGKAAGWSFETEQLLYRNRTSGTAGKAATN